MTFSLCTIIAVLLAGLVYVVTGDVALAWHVGLLTLIALRIESAVRMLAMIGRTLVATDIRRRSEWLADAPDPDARDRRSSAAARNDEILGAVKRNDRPE